MKLGLSLSFCIREIAEGKVPITDVYFIATGCSPRNANDIVEILDQYQRTYWRNCKEEAVKVFHQLHHDRKIGWLSDFQKNPMANGTTIWLELPESFG